MSERDPIEALQDRPRFGTGIGLHRVQAALELLELMDAMNAMDARGWTWLQRHDAIKVTGSNGKGSTCTMVATILQHLGLRVGLYTSPHLRRFNERIVINGAPIADAALRPSAAWCVDRIDEYERQHPEDRFGAFEAFTVAAVHAFARASVDVVVAEAGIGGRYDPTRLIPGPTCGLVSIDLEHTALLGETEEAIALDKADLCPPGGELVVGSLDAGLIERLLAHTRPRGVELYRTDQGQGSTRTILAQSRAGTRVRLKIDDLDLGEVCIGTPGLHQIDNAVVAVALARRWLRRRRPAITTERFVDTVRDALAGLRLPGRLESIREDPPVLVDVGHTPRAVERTAKTLQRIVAGAPILWVAGVGADRDPVPILRPLASMAQRIIVTRAHHRGAEVRGVVAALRTLAPHLPLEVTPTVEEALPRAIELARAHGMTVFVGGGLFLAMEAAAVVRGEDPRGLWGS
ncbi:MAG: cyanophycin synthetase [Myxococcota bacterium]